MTVTSLEFPSGFPFRFVGRHGRILKVIRASRSDSLMAARRGTSLRNLNLNSPSKSQENQKTGNQVANPTLARRK